MSEFPGYRPPTSNTTWMLNQLFEIVMPNSTEGCWRLVAYMSRKHFGWCDEQGNPVESEFEFDIKKLAKELHVSERTVNNAIAEALEKKFIHCLRPGQKKVKGSAGCHGLYTLNFDQSGKRAKTLDIFEGFFIGEGHRTAVPDEYFDKTIFTVPFPVAKVVGAIFRYTIGFQAQTGFRRQVVQLSIRRLQELTGIGGHRHLRAAIAMAIEKGYIKVVAGTSAKDCPTPTAATYQILWSDAWSGTPKAPEADEDDQRKKGRSQTTQKGTQGQEGIDAKRDTGNCAKRGTGKPRKKGHSTINTSGENYSGKQQQLQLGSTDKTPELDAAVVDFLVSVGFLELDAKAIALKTTLEDAKYCWEQAQKDGIISRHAYARSLMDKGVKVPAPTAAEKSVEKAKLKSEHEKEFMQKYEDWVMEMAERIREEENQIYREFCQQEEESPFRKARRQSGDTSYDERFPVGGMYSFTSHLKETGRIPGFWEWDRKHNPEAFKDAA